MYGQKHSLPGQDFVNCNVGQKVANKDVTQMRYKEASVNQSMFVLKAAQTCFFLFFALLLLIHLVLCVIMQRFSHALTHIKRQFATSLYFFSFFQLNST